MSLMVPDTGCPIRFTQEGMDMASWYDARGNWHLVAISDMGITYEDGDAGDNRSYAIVDRLESMGMGMRESIHAGIHPYHRIPR